MRIKNFLSCVCAASLVALSLAGCQDYDNGFTEKEIAFQDAFRKQFGDIDPEQDWNLATRATLHVDLNEKTNVKVFSAAPYTPGSVLMANYNVSSPSDLGFDMPEGTEEVFVQAICGKKMLVSGYYKVVDGVVEGVMPLADNNDDFNVTVTRNEDKDIKLSVYNGEDGNRNYTLLMYDGIPNSRGNSDIVPVPTPWRLGDMRHILGAGGVFAENVHNYKRYVKPGLLEKDVMYTIQEGGGTMSVTFEYHYTSTDKDHLAYFYWTDNDIEGKYPTYEDFQDETKNLKLYCLIENATLQSNGYVKTIGRDGQSENMFNSDIFKSTDDILIQGTTFQLVYFDGDTPTLRFPQGTHIGFAVIHTQNNNGNATGSNDSDHVWFSLQDMNISSTAWSKGALYDNGNFCTAATFRIGEKTCLGFEDWPDVDGADLNDLMFWVQGDYIEEIPELYPASNTEQSWILAYEDLGNSFDWDYNDVVLRVSHVAGKSYINITPLAAGGTLASYVKLNGNPIRRGKSIDENGNIIGELIDGTGEIHQLMGAQSEVSGSYNPINADERRDGTPIMCSFSDYYFDDASEEDKDDDGDGESNTVEGLENAFSMTVLGNREKMGGITLHVESPDGEVADIAYSLENKGKAPEVICLPGSWIRKDESGDKVITYKSEWRWPAECMNIDNAYSDFRDWAANHNVNRDWYTKTPNFEYCVKGTFDNEIDESTLGSERVGMVAGSEYNITSYKETEKIGYTSSYNGVYCIDLSNYGLASVNVSKITIAMEFENDVREIGFVDVETGTHWYHNLHLQNIATKNPQIELTDIYDLSRILGGQVLLGYYNSNGDTNSLKYIKITLE